MAINRQPKNHSLETDICPYCRSELSTKDSLVICRSCKTVHHESCWRINHRCSVFGCRGMKCGNYANNKKPAKQKMDSNQHEKIGRNDLCPCGSNHKYKDCCLKKVEQGISVVSHGKGGSARIRRGVFETYLGKKSR